MNTRNKTIDLVRGVCILLMIAGHLRLGTVFHKFCYSFHVGIFYLLSGLFYSGKGTYYIKTKNDIKKLLIPYISFGIISYTFWILFVRESEDIVSPLKQLLWDNSHSLPIASALWFLTSLFFLKQIYYLVETMAKNKSWLIGIIICCLTGLTIVLGNNIVLPFSIRSSFMCLPLFYVGVLFKNLFNNRKNTRIFDLSIIELIILAFFTTALIYLNSEINIRTNQYGNYLLFCINIICSFIVIYNLCEFLINIKKKMVQRVLNELSYVGQHSLFYLCTNQLLIRIFYFNLIKLVDNQLLVKCISFLLILFTTRLFVEMLYLAKKQICIERK